jgi:malate dehydrogenase (oxaloacetate-decarboxylating)
MPAPSRIRPTSRARPVHGWTTAPQTASSDTAAPVASGVSPVAAPRMGRNPTPTASAAVAPARAAGFRSATPAVLLTRVAPERVREVQRELQDSHARPLVTDEDVTAIALAAAALDSLAKAGRRAQGHRVVLAGARDLPVLTSLMMAAGVDDITLWNTSDATIFPLHNIVFGADLVIDLVGGLPPHAAGRLGGLTVITRADAGAAPYVAAGLLAAAVRAPGLAFDLEIFRACAQALMAVPSGRSVPLARGVAVTHLVADAVTGVFHTQLSR